MVRRVLPALIGLLSVAAVGLTAPPARAETPYTIEGYGPGSRTEPDDDFQCQASEQGAGFTWCQKTRKERGRRGSFTSSYSILRNPAGVTAYVSRSLEPAFFGGSDIQTELARLSSRFGDRPREIRPPQREGAANAVIAVWGNLKLEPLEGDALAALSKEPPRQNLLVDHLGDLKRSVELGLPVYRLSGGAGYLWSASVSAGGRGHLRFLAADPSAFVAKDRPVAAAKDRPPAFSQFVPVAKEPPATAKESPVPPAKEQLPASASTKPKKIVAAYPAAPAASASQSQPPSNPAAANTTVRGKSKPDHPMTTRPANELERAVLESERVATYEVANDHTGSIRVEADAAAPSAGFRIETIVALVGALAVLLFFFASLIERLLREPTGLELLELERRREMAEEEARHPGADVIAPEAEPRHAADWTVRSSANAAAGTLHRLATRRDNALAQVNDSLKAVMLRISPPAARS